MGFPNMTWKKIKHIELGEWDRILSKTNAHLFQYPLWNEPFRKMFFKPVYLVLEEDSQPRLFVAILCLRFGPFKLGLIQRGPVVIQGDEINEQEILALQDWLRKNWYIFVRFSDHTDKQLEIIKSITTTVAEESFPFYRDLREELIISNKGRDELFKDFTKDCRYKIRRAIKAGYILENTASIDELNEFWPLFQKVAKSKGFKRRPLKSFVSLFKCSQQLKYVRIFSVHHNGNLVAARIMIRDKNNVFSLSSALDRDAIYKNVSPGLLLHWEAMQYYFARGIKVYNFGSRSGSVYEFKNSFHPEELINSQPVTMIISPFFYNLWSKLALKRFPNTIYRLKKLLSN